MPLVNVVKAKSLRRSDSSSREVLTSVCVCVCVCVCVRVRARAPLSVIRCNSNPLHVQ